MPTNDGTKPPGPVLSPKRFYLWVVVSGIGLALMLLFPDDPWFGSLVFTAAFLITLNPGEFRRVLTPAQIIAGLAPIALILAVILVGVLTASGVWKPPWAPSGHPWGRTRPWFEGALVLLWFWAVARAWRRIAHSAKPSAA